jgi:chromosome segregation ATPase
VGLAVRLRRLGAKFIFHIKFTVQDQRIEGRMQNGVSAAVAAMEQAVRRLDAALAQRGAAFRSLAEQHGLAAAELKALRDELQQAREEAASLRERAALVDALRTELAQIQSDEAAAPRADDAALRGLLAARDSEIAALKDEVDDLNTRLASAVDAKVALQAMVTAPRAVPAPAGGSDNELAALKAELAAARAAQAEAQAFQTGVAARLEATMARLREALDADAKV